MPLRSRSRSIEEESPPVQSNSSGPRQKEKPGTVHNPPPPPPPTATLAQQAFAGTAHLANLLPTGTLLAFQMLTPVFSGNGRCDVVTRPLTKILLLVLAGTAFLACFTDSFRSSSGKLFYGLATRRGMWLFDSSVPEAEVPDLTKYRLRLVDFVHAVMSVLVFGSVAMKEKNVVGCFYPHPGHEVQEFLNIVPLGIGFFCTMMFVIFPTRRHGIGYPVADGN